MDEIWKPINNYEEIYEVSNTGSIRSLERRGNWKAHIMSLINSTDGYIRVTLCKNSKAKMYLVHRLVAEHFIPNPGNKPCINHKDGNKQNNKVDNLEWCTYSENELHAMNTGLVNKNKMSMAHKKPIVQYTLSGDFVKEYDSIKQANDTNVNIYGTSISKCLTGVYKTAGGYIWKYRENDGKTD